MSVNNMTNPEKEAERLHISNCGRCAHDVENVRLCKYFDTGFKANLKALTRSRLDALAEAREAVAKLADRPVCECDVGQDGCDCSGKDWNVRNALAIIDSLTHNPSDGK